MTPFHIDVDGGPGILSREDLTTKLRSVFHNTQLRVQMNATSAKCRRAIMKIGSLPIQEGTLFDKFRGFLRVGWRWSSG